MPANDLMHAESTALVLVDYQQRLLPAIHEGAAVLARALRLAQIARALELPVLGTEQNPAGLGPNAAPLRELCDRTLAKMHFDACADGLVEALAALPGPASAAPRQVVLAGCEAHVCLMQTGLGLLRSGHRVWVVDEACGSRRATDQAAGIARLVAAGATRVSVEMVAFEGLRACTHPRFKAVLPLLKTPAA